MHSRYRNDLENRFPDYRFATIGVGDLFRVQATDNNDGGALVLGVLKTRINGGWV